MSKRQRFYLNNNGYIVDRLDWTNNGLVWTPEELPDGEYMRKRVFRARLKSLFDQLLPSSDLKKYPQHERLEKFVEVENALVEMVSAVGERCLECDIHHQNDRPAHRAKVKGPGGRLQDIASIALFARDLEALASNIYEISERDASAHLRKAIIATLKMSMNESLLHLWNEYCDAFTVDGDSRIPGYPHKYDSYDEADAFERLLARAKLVKKHPARFGTYTVKFIKIFEINLKERTPPLDGYEGLIPEEEEVYYVE